ncbi:hypothetical protein ACP4OV_011694 [Aristida adscensionis]
MHSLVLALFSLVFTFHTPLCSAATDTLLRGQVISGNRRLVSGNGRFALGFFQMGSKPSNTYLGIWFDKVPKLTPVWTANRDNPVLAAAAPELMISDDGNLVFLTQGSITWSTQAIATNDYRCAPRQWQSCSSEFLKPFRHILAEL